MVQGRSKKAGGGKGPTATRRSTNNATMTWAMEEGRKDRRPGEETEKARKKKQDERGGQDKMS